MTVVRLEIGTDVTVSDSDKAKGRLDLRAPLTVPQGRDGSVGFPPVVTERGVVGCCW